MLNTYVLEISSWSVNPTEYELLFEIFDIYRYSYTVHNMKTYFKRSYALDK